MRIPADIKENIRKALWEAAANLDWSGLTDMEKSKYYELWTRNPAIGGQLAHFMDPRQVRVYIKDSLLKSYVRARLSDNEPRVWVALGRPAPTQYARQFIKPHGKRLLDGAVVCWGNSRDWKLILMAVFERSRVTPHSKPEAAALFEVGHTATDGQRGLVREAARRLGIEKLVWLD